MAIRRECAIEYIVDFRRHRPAPSPLESPKVSQTAAPPVITSKPVSVDLKPRNPFPNGSWLPS